MKNARSSLCKWACTVTLLLLSSTLQAQPSCTLVCPANAFLGTPPGEESATFAFSTPTPAGSCISNTVLQTSGLPSPGQFAVGTTTNCFSVGNNEASCCFNVQVTATPALKPVPTMGMGSILLLVAMTALLLARRLRSGRKP
jgi:hypothetical protein